jgi:hypothetical protein
MRISAPSQRVLLWGGVVLATVYFIGYAVLMGFMPPPPPELSADEVAQLYTGNNTRFRIGVVLMLVCAGFNQLWTVVISAQMVRDEKGVPIWSIMQATAGTLSTWLFMGPPIFWGVAAFSAATRDPALTLLMHELAFITFITPVAMFPLQVVPIAVVCLTRKSDDYTSAFPRWLGYFTGWMVVSAEAGVAALLFNKTGPFAWNGLFPFWIPLSLFGFWLGAVIFCLLRAIGRQEAAGAVAGATS